jgi:hypothetical protein
LKLSITWLTLENFEQPKDHIFCIFKLEQSNYWKIFGILEKGFNGPARLHSAVRCRFELTAYKAPECRASVHHPDHAHLCVLPAVILIRSARVSSKPRYFPHFASRRALCTARCCSSNECHRPKLRHRRVGPHPLATMHRAVDRSAAPSAFPPSGRARACRLPLFAIVAAPSEPPPQHRRATVHLRPRTTTVWSTSLSRRLSKEALKSSATSSPSVAGRASSWPAFFVHSLTPPSHPRAPPNHRGAHPTLQAHC